MRRVFVGFKPGPFSEERLPPRECPKISSARMVDLAVTYRPSPE